MTTRKSPSTEQLAKVLEFSIQELQRDLEKFSTEEKKFLNDYIIKIQEALKKDIPVNTDKLDNLLRNFENRFGQKIDKHVKALEKQKGEMRIFYISLGLFFLSAIMMFTSYLFGIKGADKVRSNHYKDLKAEGILIENKEDIEFIKAWKIWAEKNPKDSKKIKEVINK